MYHILLRIHRQDASDYSSSSVPHGDLVTGRFELNKCGHREEDTVREKNRIQGGFQFRLVNSPRTRLKPI